MGQYYKGTKIGTCESMFYMRLATAQKLAKQGEQDDDGIKFSDYLTDNTTMWRFPFPNEDKKDLLELNHDETFNLPAGDIEVNHDTITVYNEHKGGGYGMNIMIPCPYAKEFKLATSHAGAGEQFISIRFQAIRDGEEKTLFECARCGQLQRTDNETMKKIKERATEYYEVYNNEYGKKTYDHAMKIIKRIK